VFECEIQLDTTRKVSLKGFLFEQTVPLFRSDEKVTGKGASSCANMANAQAWRAVVIKSPPNRAVSHYGVRVELESSMQFYDSLNSISVTPSDENAGMEAAREGVVEGTIEVPFELNLALCKGKDGKPMVESYDGEKFDVRHALLVTIKRPWYTFAVTRVTGIAIQNIAPAPASDDLARAVPTQLGVVSRVPSIVVDDCGGTCTFSYGRAHWNIGDTIHGTLKFSDKLAKPLTAGRLVLYKIEIADGDTQEKTVKEIVIFGPAETAATPKEGEEAPPPRPAPARTEPVVGGESLDVTFPLVAEPHGPSIGPTYDELNDEDAPVNVHYYLRILLEDGSATKEAPNNGKFWNTHEIVLYRSKLSGTESV